MLPLSRRSDSAVSARKTGSHRQKLLCTPILGKMFLIVIDVHSKGIETFPVNTSTSSATIEKLRITVATHGLPEVVVTE